MISRGKKKKLTREQKLCLIGYILIPVFFVILYFLMTQTYEDIAQGNSRATMSIGGIIKDIYNYIPRLGEFYQHIAAHFMTPQASLGMDMVFRLTTAAITTGTIFLAAVFVLGRKLKLQYKDMFIAVGILVFLMASAFSETFTYRFSYVNNYAIGLLVAIAFLLPFRMCIQSKKWWALAGAAILGFCVGISTEITPIAFLAIVGIWVLVQLIRKKITFADLWGKYRLQSVLIIGLLAGLAFFYLGGGLAERTGGGYAKVYDYVSPFGLLKTPIVTGRRLLHHIWYNLRYVFFALPLMFSYVLIEKSVFKKNIKSLFWQVMAICFCALFIGATCVIAVHDDLYPRFMIPVFIAILCATMIFVNDVIEYSKPKEKVLKRTAISAVVVGGILVADMTVAFALYNGQMASKLHAVQRDPGKSITIDSVDDYYMEPSPVFQLQQLPPFDWGPAGSHHMKFGL